MQEVNSAQKDTKIADVFHTTKMAISINLIKTLMILALKQILMTIIKWSFQQKTKERKSKNKLKKILKMRIVLIPIFCNLTSTKRV